MPGRLDRKDLAKYPFLKEAQEWVAGRTGSLPDFFSSNYGRIAARHAVERIRDAMEGGRPAAPGPERLDPDREVYAYAIARVLVSCTRDRLLMDRLSRYEAERASRYLADEAPATRALVAEGVGMPTEAGD
ncbi:MAG: primase, large subunit, partial [Methanomicrobia archaeon]|nr:primase, large subunit [Methanomicrobia archaeon]